MAGRAAVDIDDLRRWIGKTETLRDVVTAAPLHALAALLDHEPAPFNVGQAIPPCWHWLYFLPFDRQSELAADGLARRGGFLPPVPLPRRMRAGGAIDFRRPLHVGDAVTQSTRIVDVTAKQGRSGPLVFVTVRYEIIGPAGLAVVEDQDLVYREFAAPGAPPVPGTPAQFDPVWTREVRADEVLLFRYSAVTFNGHRIHYDRRYAVEVEGYPGLVVHGPLSATLLLDLLHRSLPGADVTHFKFRSVAPVFDDAPFVVCGRPGDRPDVVHLWTQRQDGTLAMEATATLRGPTGQGA